MTPRSADVDWDALVAYVRSVSRARRPRPRAPDDPALVVDERQVLRYRALVTHLDERLPRHEIAAAAYGGLQDSAPRAALLALHARAEGIDTAAWEDAVLAQVWLRSADYVVPRDAVGVFTLGAMPRHPEHAAAVDAFGQAIVDVLAGQPASAREIAARIPGLPGPLLIRNASVSGRVLIRWDARTLDVIPVERPPIDVEEARLGLARRFLHWRGPASPADFAFWAGVARQDAADTWAALAPELVAVEVSGRGGWVLADDLTALKDAAGAPWRGVRFLPDGDPYRQRDTEVVGAATGAAPPRLEPSESVTRRLINSLTGRVVLDGDIVAAWGRVQANVTIAPWVPLSSEARRRVDADAESLALPIGRPMRLRWLD